MNSKTITRQQLAGMFDHTLLKAFATKEDFRKLCEEAKELGTAMVAINPSPVAWCKEFLKDTTVHVGAAISFPLGQTPIAMKVAETKKAIEDGADEIDMVISVGQLKAGSYDEVYEDVKAVREACQGKVLKLIFENCLLTDEEKIKACEIAVRAGVDYVKTSTGFSSGGATISDVALMKAHVDGKCKVKAAGGIRDYNTAIAMIDAGADRLGTSATVKIVNERQ